jgi:Lrp/AsnC family transcriptional regulator, leucine-responsive regulatory protein
MQKTTARELDAFDLRILALYQDDVRITTEALGEHVGLSAAAVQRRLKRMRETGVIEAEVARICPRMVGLPLTCIVNVDIDRETATDLDRFKARMLACADVQQCYYVTGEADFILVLLVADMEAYEAFTRAHLLADANVHSFTTQVVMDRVKTGVSLPLSALRK